MLTKWLFGLPSRLSRNLWRPCRNWISKGRNHRTHRPFLWRFQSRHSRSLCRARWIWWQWRWWFVHSGRNPNDTRRRSTRSCTGCRHAGRRQWRGFQWKWYQWDTICNGSIPDYLLNWDDIGCGLVEKSHFRLTLIPPCFFSSKILFVTPLLLHQI